MADKRAEKPGRPPVPARSAGLPDPASAPPPARSDAGAAPASVRDFLKGAQPEPAAPASRPTPPPSVREVAPAAGVSTLKREITVDEEVWVLRQEGAGCIGYDRAAGATILSIGLEPPGNPKDVLATRYVLARTLDDVAEEELVCLVREVARAPDPARKASPSARPGPSQNAPPRRRGRPRRGPRR